MKRNEKILVCAVAYLAAGGLWFAVASPAFNDSQQKSTELAAKTQENTELKIKLSDNARLQREHQQLQAEIDQLRGSVPKSPDVDVLIIDLEKMVLDAGMDIVSIDTPTPEKLKQVEESQGEEAPATPGAPRVSQAVSGGLKPAAPAQAPKPAAPQPPGTKASGPAPVETGLERQVLQVTVQGSYPDFIELMKKLEAYQRVIGVSQVELGFPTTGKETKAPDSKQLKISFYMTAYYLP